MPGACPIAACPALRDRSSSRQTLARLIARLSAPIRPPRTPQSIVNPLGCEPIFAAGLRGDRNVGRRSLRGSSDRALTHDRDHRAHNVNRLGSVVRRAFAAQGHSGRRDGAAPRQGWKLLAASAKRLFLRAPDRRPPLQPPSHRRYGQSQGALLGVGRPECNLSIFLIPPCLAPRVPLPPCSHHGSLQFPGKSLILSSFTHRVSAIMSFEGQPLVAFNTPIPRHGTSPQLAAFSILTRRSSR